MKSSIFIIVLVFFFQFSYAQEIENKTVDSLYKEDQFYTGLTYNILGNKPANLTQSGFSIGFHLGFIKDMPINKNRNMAIGVGFGYATNTYNQNLQISKSLNNTFNYIILENTSDYTKNKFTGHFVELPIEFRWRTSTPTKYDFWRIYSGFKLSYLFASTAKYDGNLGAFKYNNMSDFNDLQYGVTLCVGYNTWNFYAYYALNPVFSSNATLDNKPIDMNSIKIGLMFYIL